MKMEMKYRVIKQWDFHNQLTAYQLWTKVLHEQFVTHLETKLHSVPSFVT
jgi:hypothetical protein